MKIGLLRESCESVCADVSVDLCVQGGRVCEVAELFSDCFSCRHRMMRAGGKHAATPQIFFPSSHSSDCLSWSPPVLSFHAHPSFNNKVPSWEE